MIIKMDAFHLTGKLLEILMEKNSYLPQIVYVQFIVIFLLILDFF